MLILIAGGSGYVGRGIIERYCLSRDFINVSLTRHAALAVNNVLVDLSKPINFLRFDKPIDMIINCVECRAESYAGDEKNKRAYLAAVRHLVEYAQDMDIKKIIHFSVNHINTVENDYQQARFVAEGLIKSSGLDYIIFKPTVIFGENSPLEYLINSLLSRSVLLKFWKEEAQIAPVHLLDVLANVGYAIEHDDCWNETYALCGPEMMNFEEMLFRRRMIKRPKLVNAPSALARRSALKNAPVPSNHLRLLLDWVNADDSHGYARTLVAPQFSYKP
ncbi:MAG: NAD-dependent epimerase/dehydratase family protein [Helicobacteraceae bacterium]|jgi:NADH dehydrogenase|nr:NAD-dependent epimerase/dehydratase family protein [Helicobacteraceae bacterium]